MTLNKEDSLRPSALLVYVDDIQQGLIWYKQAFPESRSVCLKEFNLTVLDINGFSLEIVQADAKVSSGKSGTVLYWSVLDLEKEIERFQNLGASLYRGPMVIEDGLGMCQVEDPFGNLIGLKGVFKPLSNV